MRYGNIIRTVLLCCISTSGLGTQQRRVSPQTTPLLFFLPFSQFLWLGGQNSVVRSRGSHALCNERYLPFLPLLFPSRISHPSGFQPRLLIAASPLMARTRKVAVKRPKRRDPNKLNKNPTPRERPEFAASPQTLNPSPPRLSRPVHRHGPISPL